MDHNRRLWFVLILFLAAVLLPTACVLWLINDSIAKQRQIARQQLAEAYRSHLKLAAERLDEYWRQESAKLMAGVQGTKPQQAWASAVASGLADSLVLYGEDGGILYPIPLAAPILVEPASDWTRARALEQRASLDSSLAAAAVYGSIASQAKDAQTIGLALQAQARSLRQGGERIAAATLILERFGAGQLQDAVDSQGRRIAGDALLMAIQILPASDPRRLRAARQLHGQLIRYDANAMPSAQRLFLMKEMRGAKLPADLTSFPTFEAEELAIRFVEAGSTRAFDGVLRPAGWKDVWMLGAESGQAAGLFKTESVKKRVQEFAAAQPLPPHVRMAMLERGASAAEAIETISAGTYLPEWRLALFSSGQRPFDELANRQMGLYIWIGALVVAAVTCIALAAGRIIHRQMRLASLKSDLVATVSHELKTPLTSIRLLLDTLLEQDTLEPVRMREYLELMERESARLTHMIENFLAFSRLERNRYNFRFGQVRPAEIVERATEVFAERAAEPRVRLSVDVAPDLPSIHADPGALSTVLINLLDNAYKYTQEDKQIDLRAFESGGKICFEVRDNGVGVAKSETAKVFRDFYQVDSRLARTQGGCGLGLSIVKFIVEAHKGVVSLDSNPGRGSTFTVAVPSSQT